MGVTRDHFEKKEDTKITLQLVNLSLNHQRGGKLRFRAIKLKNQKVHEIVFSPLDRVHTYCQFLIILGIEFLAFSCTFEIESVKLNFSNFSLYHSNKF